MATQDKIETGLASGHEYGEGGVRPSVLSCLSHGSTSDWKIDTELRKIRAGAAS